MLLETGHYLSPGRGGGGGAEDVELNEVKFSRYPFECYFTEVIPPKNNFRDLLLPMSSFSKQI